MRAFPVLLALFVVESVRAYPHYLAYFNQITGREHAYEHLVDSSLDWGQDLRAKAIAREPWMGWIAQASGVPDVFRNSKTSHYGIGASLQRDSGQSISPCDPVFTASAQPHFNAFTRKAQGAWTEKYEASYQALRKYLGSNRTSAGCRTR